MLNQSLVWSLPPTDLVLSSKDVHVWRACLEQPEAVIQQLADTLSEDERIRADRFYFERDRKHFIVGRGLLRTILGRYLIMEPQQLQFCYSPRGKPTLASTETGGSLQFNLSHSQGLVLYGITRDRQIGIDIEQIRPTSDVEKLAQRFFSAHEHAVIRSLPPTQKQEAFFHGWTCKEAYLKAIGEGLAQLEEVEVSLVPGEPAQLLRIGKDSQASKRWSLQMLRPAPNYMAALAVEGQNWRLTCWQWSTKS
ncbi:MAG TPA: 4'-phosphopantetheinyl transferase superfamily protein [Coleofasciculaceae cyanobacterium]